MALETRTFDVITCDGCGAEEILPDDAMPVGWYNGEVIHHHEGGGSGGSWHACKPAHIKQAVLNVVEGSN